MIDAQKPVSNRTLLYRGGVLTNTGGFQNLQPRSYWFGTEMAGSPQNALIFKMDDGYSYFAANTDVLYALAVRPGDVAAAIPEPETYALMLAGLFTVALAKRRQRA